MIDVAKNKVGDINITVNGGGGGNALAAGSNSVNGNQGPASSVGGEQQANVATAEDNKRIANLIKEQVVAILADEKRLGGQLRR